MASSAYVGRVAGLVIALGVGTAILTGQGIAAADTGDGGASGSADTSASASSGASPSTGSAETGMGRETGASADDDDDGDGAGDRARPAPRTKARSADTTWRSSPRSPTLQRETIDSEAAESEGVDAGSNGVTTDLEDTVRINEPVVADDPVPAPRVEQNRGSGQDAIALTAVVDPAESDDQNTDDVPLQLPTPPSLPAATRRELAAEPASGYTPTVTVVDGVITGTNGATSPKNTYAVIGDPVTDGKVNFDAITGNFTFLPNSTQFQPWGYDQFRVLTMQKSGFVQFLETVPVLKYFVQPTVVRLHKIPVLGQLLTPIIGTAQRNDVRIEMAEYVGGDPIAFTTTVISFDRTRISVNYFPKIGLSLGETAPTILNGPSLATAGYTDPTQLTTVLGLVPGLAVLRPDYNVVTWDPRGEFASTGRMHLDSELFEARDVSAIISWVSQQAGTAFDPGTEGRVNPLIGMVGGSYGGGIQLTSAGVDGRIDAIVPGIAWNSLTGALYPQNAFKTSWASLLLLALVVQDSRLDPEIYSGIITGAITGFLTGRQQDFLQRNSPATVVGDITAPTLFIQGTVDTLFPLQQAMANAAAIADGVPVKMIWYCGGHGTCLDPSDTAGQSAFLLSETMNWLDTYVMNKTVGAPPPVDGPKFTWVDQTGSWYATDDLPIDPGFNDPDPITVSGGGGYLAIAPFLGGSGPQNQWTFPLGLTLAAPARYALNVPIPDPAETTYIVGAPKLSFTYSGLGTSRHVFAQIVDRNTNRVVGNIASPIPVRLDGGTYTIPVPIDMEAIAYTLNPGDDLVLQITDSATSFANGTAFGVIRISDVSLDLPVATDVIPLTMASGAGALAGVR
jgi:ABC-2 type transport system ATP-binding protein